MKHDIIKTDNYLLVVDESEIKEGDWYYYENGKTLKGVEQVVNGKIAKTMASKKIISHLPLNGSPALKGVDLLPPLEDDVESSNNGFDEKNWNDYWVNILNKESCATNGKRDVYIDGYLKAKEKYKFTEEDMVTFGIITSKAFSIVEGKGYIDMQKFDKILQSLSQPKMPIGFECNEMIIPAFKDKFGNIRTEKKQLKTTTTPEGHTQWMGTYIYSGPEGGEG